MAYGRYDRGREPRPARSAYDDDRSPRFSGDRDERGFFERAGDEISSWFSDDDRRSDQDRRPRFIGEDDRFDRSARHRDEGYRRPYTGRSGGFDDQGRRDTGYQPMTGDYGRSSRFERDRESGSSFSGMASTTPHDRHYGEWRQRQISELDRDYDEYRRENQARFESDFSNWRTVRQSKRQMLSSIREHMPVVGSDDQPVGTVDKVRGDRVILDKKADEAEASWGSEERDRALFERDDEREPGAHILERSFSGTY